MSTMREKIKQAILDGINRAAELNAARKADTWVVGADQFEYAAGSVEALIKAEFKESPEALTRWAAG